MKHMIQSEDTKAMADEMRINKENAGTDVFINLTNHPSAVWSDTQKKAAREYGEIEDLSFPAVPADWSTEQIAGEAARISRKVIEKHPAAVLVQGEFTLTHSLICRLQAASIRVFAAITERRSREEICPDGSTEKTSVFEFKGFREYER